MKPAPFAYHAPDTVDEVLELLARGDGTRLLAGGQSLVPLMKFRVEKPSTIVDLNRVPGLAEIGERDGTLTIGALVRQQALVEDETARRAHPLLAVAGRHAGYLATRHRGTVGGSLAYAAPWAELTAAVVALDAIVLVTSTRGERTIPAREFFLGSHETALERDELLTGVEISAAPSRTGAGFHEVTTGRGGYLNAAAAAVVTVDDDRRCTGAELVLLRVAPTPHRLDVGDLEGGSLAADAIDSVLASVDRLEPEDDIEVSGRYRRRVARTLARRALFDAYEEACAA